MSFSPNPVTRCAAVLLITAASALQAVHAEIYFRTDVDTIKGEVADAKHRSWMEATTVSFAATQSPLEFSGGDISTGKVAVGPVEIVKLGDRADAGLFTMVTSGGITNVCIDLVRSAGGDSVVFQQILLESAVPINMAPLLGGDSDRPLVSLTFDYAKIQILTFSQDQTGAVSQSGEACFDRLGNTACTSVTAACTPL
jgi:type VI protein secretion system component Hcp